MRYRVLGPVEVVDERGDPAPVVGSRQQRLLAVLLAHAGEAVPADRLAESLWGARQPADPAAALQSQVSRLRHRLAGAVEFVGGGYRLRPASGELDAAVFEQRLAEARAAPDPGESLRLLDAALSLWRGTPYGGDDLDVLAAVQRLEELRRSAAEERAAALLALGRYAEAAEQAASLVRNCPLRERAVEIAMEALHAAGRTSEALATYQAYRRQLAEELGLDPGEELRALHLRMIRGERTITGRATLPRPVTTYVSDGEEVSSVSGAVVAARHVTLTGPGGVGKTRLAVEVANRLTGAFPDDVWFCDLAAVTDGDAVPAAAASLLGIHPRHDRSTTDRLVEVLRGWRALLVLDNCEHVRDAAAQLTQQVIEHTDQVRVLATSREPLGVPGEQRIGVAPLSEDAAARLFVDRAAAARPGLTLSGDDLAAVRQICREVAGLPLAVELAAARTSARTPREIAGDLAARVDRLSGTRSGLARHRSVVAVVDWSLDRLPDRERELAEHLAVFAGGCTAESAAAVVCGETAEVADRLVRLVEHSVVTPREIAGYTRYLMLEPVRARAEQRLRDRGVLTVAARRHATYCAGLAAAAAAGLRSSESAHWLRTLDDDLANLRAAYRRCLDTDAVDTALRLLAPLYLYAWSRMTAEVSEWAEVAATQTAAHGHPALPAVLALAALGAGRRGDLPRARDLAERATAADGPPSALAPAFEALGDVLFLDGRPDQAVVHYQTASANAAAAGDTFYQLMFAADTALARGYAGNDTAGAAADEVCASAESTGSPLLIAWTHFIAGEVRLDRSPEEALPHLRQAAQLARSLGDRFTATAATLSATSIQARHGDPHAALADLADIIDAWHRAGSWQPTWVTLRLCIEVFIRLEEYEAAARLLAALKTSTTAGPAYGTDATRLATAETTLQSCLGPSYHTIATQGEALGDNGALTLARHTLRSRGLGK